MGVELPLRAIVTILECCVTFSGVKLSIRSFVLLQERLIKKVKTSHEITLVKLNDINITSLKIIHFIYYFYIFKNSILAKLAPSDLKFFENFYQNR